MGGKITENLGFESQLQKVKKILSFFCSEFETITNISSAILLKYPFFGGVFCAVQGLCSHGCQRCLASAEFLDLWWLQIFEVLCANWQPASSLLQNSQRQTTGIQAARARYLPFLWPEQKSGATIEPNDITLFQFYSLVYFFHDNSPSFKFLSQALASVLKS